MPNQWPRDPHRADLFGTSKVGQETLAVSQDLLNCNKDFSDAKDIYNHTLPSSNILIECLDAIGLFDLVHFTTLSKYYYITIKVLNFCIILKR